MKDNGKVKKYWFKFLRKCILGVNERLVVYPILVANQSGKYSSKKPSLIETFDESIFYKEPKKGVYKKEIMTLIKPKQVKMTKLKLMFRKYSIYILIALLMTSCTGYYMFKNTPDWWETKEEVTATVIEVYHQPETVFRYQFFVDGNRYEGGYAYYVNEDGVVPGSKFKVAYNPENPNQNHIQLYKQLFEKEEDVAYTVGEAGTTSIFPVERDSIEVIRLWFFIRVNGRDYKAIRNDFVNTFGYTEEDVYKKKFKVKYWINNPYRSIILLDQPVEE